MPAPPDDVIEGRAVAAEARAQKADAVAALATKVKGQTEARLLGALKEKNTLQRQLTQLRSIPASHARRQSSQTKASGSGGGGCGGGSGGGSSTTAPSTASSSGSSGSRMAATPRRSSSTSGAGPRGTTTMTIGKPDLSLRDRALAAGRLRRARSQAAAAQQQVQHMSAEMQAVRRERDELLRRLAPTRV